MTYNPRVPARERTPFGSFELHPSHLITGRSGLAHEPAGPQPADVVRSAALTVCDQVGTAVEAAPLLDMLGLLDHPDLLQPAAASPTSPPAAAQPSAARQAEVPR